MKSIFAFLLLLSTQILPASANELDIDALLASCSGRTTSCYSSCDGGYIPVAGDKCESYYDSSRGCYSARGVCGGNNNPPPGGGCRGRSTSCYSSCDGGYVRFDNANACTSAYNSSRGCYEGIGYCNE